MGRRYSKKQATNREQCQAHNMAMRSFVLSGIAALIILGGLTWAWQIIRAPGFLPIQHINIKGDYQHVDRNALQQQLLALVQGGFFNIDLSGIVTTARALPWVASVRVRRVWPSTIDVILTEQRPVARWGKDSLLADTGTIFTPHTLDDFNDLPQFQGPPDLSRLMLDMYQQIQALLAPRHLTVRLLTLTNRRSWFVQLNNNMRIMLGKDAVLDRLTRFVDTYPQVFRHKKAENAYIDLRYTNGFAVK